MAPYDPSFVDAVADENSIWNHLEAILGLSEAIWAPTKAILDNLGEAVCIGYRRQRSDWPQ